MFLIRRIFDNIAPANRNALAQVGAMLWLQFDDLDREKIDRIPEVLRHPLKYGFRTILYVAEDHRYQLRGLALLDHDADLSFCYLDYLASDGKLVGRGVGGALYQRVRSEALSLGVVGVFFECLPDDPVLCRSSETLKKNRTRLRFYEGFGARPIVNTAYETPVKPGGDNPPYLVFDGLGRRPSLSAAYVKQVVTCILKRKYGDICSPAYIRMVVDSVRDDPVRLRPPHYRIARKTEDRHAAVAFGLTRIALVVTDQHEIHHVRDRGYVESPVRIRAILQALQTTDIFDTVPPAGFGHEALAAVHDRGYLAYFKQASMYIDEDVPLYPYVFPIRNRARPPVELPIRAGYYCIDTFTPISKHAYIAARRAVDCALTAAREIISGRRIAYALVRPPGHHAEHGCFGGFCYFNNAAIAAHYLSKFGNVAILDVDYHHGNGQQDIFYHRRDVLTVSIHGHPRFAYPYFSGFADERGDGDAIGFNINYPLPENCNPSDYLDTLGKALRRIKEFRPTYLVVCLGLDTAKGDPTGTWNLTAQDFASMGRQIGQLCLPCLVIQEGGYRTRSIGSNARSFFLGTVSGMGQQGFARRRDKPRVNALDGSDVRIKPIVAGRS
jgi:acetoin utilization deacetylase AcuC-like enzyme/GNAT superfamily N-acetyltransferase